MAGGDEDMDTTGAGELNVHRARRTVLSPRQPCSPCNHDRRWGRPGRYLGQPAPAPRPPVAVQAARKAQVDRAAAVEAQQPHAVRYDRPTG